jgi:hypothetical protein
MTLKELYEKGKDAVYDVLEIYLHENPEYRAIYSFEDYLQEDIITCPRCGEINKRDDMSYHVWDTGNLEELICESCRNDEVM